MISESKFQMWRGTIALAQVDNHVSKEEKLWLDQHLKKIPFTKEQREILQNDFEKGIKLDDIFLNSLEPRERGMLVSFANTIFKRDGLAPEEEIVLSQLTGQIMGDLKVEELTSEVERMEEESHEEENIFKRLVTIITSLI
ncbi:hypothetical protein BMS_2462 [Halobacteriovorax marinus SJ]|uniref:Co-chaperone DjlA N-terminal domain-containing protein n=1 Tax=Halobacteriovorax marinus (strain ATCC BAA-682 / DSM 15412 / SJ) TaxID=862908 RepID=E1X5D4_HALMS|nr:TerB family tellurite resistance protein [Halobacteriovorax marinus]CBW27255.1 hypothetical protein BMS_2462 [Halobacteriovorax marinus SJ]